MQHTCDSDGCKGDCMESPGLAHLTPSNWMNNSNLELQVTTFAYQRALGVVALVAAGVGCRDRADQHSEMTACVFCYYPTDARVLTLTSEAHVKLF